MTIEATTIVEFNDAGEGAYILEASLDDVLNEDSSFFHGDDIYFWINKSNNLKIVDVISTLGSITFHSDNTRSDMDTFNVNPDDLINSIREASPNVTDIYYHNQGKMQKVVDTIGKTSFIADENFAPFSVDVSYMFPVQLYKLNTSAVQDKGRETNITITIKAEFIK